ncbi:MAG TPA: hypothetical protein VJX23_03570 [Candidatus Binataceae bacterium]|nr:hypothetical protein [Candidatus Binataceae bacterium]
MLALAVAPAEASPRDWQPLVLKGAQIPGLVGARIDRLEVLAFHDGRLEPIPFQADEIAIDGSYALPGGPQPTVDDSPGIIDNEDEIAMMISDLGERAAAASGLPRGAFEIEVSDPLGGQDRYAYIAAVDSPHLSAVSYVAFDPAVDSIETSHYRVGLTNGLPSDFAMQDRMNERRPNLIDRFKVRLSTMVLHLFHFSFSEDDIHSRVLAWKAGPIRVIRRLSHSVNLVLGLHSPVFERNDFFYRDYLENPFKMHLSWAPRIFFGDIRVRLDLDFNDLSDYELLWSQMAMPPVRIGDAKMEQAISHAPPASISWIAVRGHGHTTIQTLAPTPDLALLDRQLYFNDDWKTPDPPERTPGEHPGIGYVITGWEKLESGTHEFDSLLISTPGDYSPDVLLRELHTPALAKARRAAETK